MWEVMAHQLKLKYPRAALLIACIADRCKVKALFSPVIASFLSCLLHVAVQHLHRSF